MRSSATRRARRCRNRRGTCSIRSTSSTARRRRTLVAKLTSNLMDPRQAESIAQAHAAPVPERDSGVRRRCAAVHVREPGDVRAHAQFRPQPLRGLPQFLQQAVERDALRADERRRQGCRPRRGDAEDADFRRPLAARPPAAREARHRDASRRVSLRSRGARALRIRLGRILRLVRRAGEGAAGRAEADNDAAAGRGTRSVARSRARGDAAPRASVHSVHHRRAVADVSRRSPAKRARRSSCSRSRRRISSASMRPPTRRWRN